MDDQRQLQEANRTNTISNNEADFRKYLSSLRSQGPQALEQAQASGAIDARLAGYNGLVSRDLDPTAVLRENILGARSDATTDREYTQGEARAAAEPILQEYQARLLQDPNAAQAYLQMGENESILRNAMLLDEAASAADSRGQELTRRNRESKEFSRKELGWERDDAYEDVLNNITTDVPYYQARDQFISGLGNLTSTNRLRAMADFDKAYSFANQLSEDDVVALRADEDRILKATKAQVQEHQAEAAAARKAYEERIPLGARQDSPFRTTADLTKWILEKGNVERDYLVGNDLQAGVDNLVTALNKHLGANPKLAQKLTDLGYNTLGIAADIAMRNVFDKDEQGNLIFELANWNWGKEEPKFITAILNEYAENDYVTEGINYLNKAPAAEKAARDLPANAVDDIQKAYQTRREAARNRKTLLDSVKN
jgi:hypothetical protein